MPFSKSTRENKKIPSLNNKSEGESEDIAIPKAIAAANKVKKSMKLEKNTNRDFQRIADKLIHEKFKGCYDDHDAEYIYFERYEVDSFNCYKVSYETSESGIELGDEIIPVQRLTEYKEITKNVDQEKPPNWFKQFLNSFSKEEDSITPVCKQFSDEEMIAIEPLYVATGEVDLHGDMIESPEVMEDMVKSFNEANAKGILQSSLFHNHKTKSFKIMKAWVNQCECYIGDHLVPEGQPIVKIQFTNEKAWELRKQGKLTGLSIYAKGKVTEVEDE